MIIWRAGITVLDAGQDNQEHYLLDTYSQPPVTRIRLRARLPSW